jgi:hypothetical protein
MSITKDYTNADSDDEGEERAENKIVAHVREQEAKAKNNERRAIQLDPDFTAWLAIGSLRSGSTIANYTACVARAGRVTVGMQRGIPAKETMKAVGTKDPADVRSLFWMRLAALYCLVPRPRRDLAFLRITPDDQHNSFDRVRGEINYVSFKTAKVMGQVRVKMDNALVLQLMHLLIDRCRNPGDVYMFVGKGGRPFASERTFAEFLARTFEDLVGKPLRPAVLRKIYISDLWRLRHL